MSFWWRLIYLLRKSPLSLIGPILIFLRRDPLCTVSSSSSKVRFVPGKILKHLMKINHGKFSGQIMKEQRLFNQKSMLYFVTSILLYSKAYNFMIYTVFHEASTQIINIVKTSEYLKREYFNDAAIPYPKIFYKIGKILIWCSFRQFKRRQYFMR